VREKTAQVADLEELRQTQALREAAVKAGEAQTRSADAIQAKVSGREKRVAAMRKHSR
jgi:hypothetical protein